MIILYLLIAFIPQALKLGSPDPTVIESSSKKANLSSTEEWFSESSYGLVP